MRLQRIRKFEKRNQKIMGQVAEVDFA